MLNPTAMLAHAAAGTEHEVDGMNTVDVENHKCSTPFWVGTRVFIVMSELDNVSNFSETTILEKAACPLLEHVSL